MQHVSLINTLGASRTPFLFIADFKGEQWKIHPLDKTFPKDISYDINGVSNVNIIENPRSAGLEIQKKPVDFSKYQTCFTKVVNHIHRGDSFLVNLTFPTPIYVNGSLTDIFNHSKAKYKLLYKNDFVVFSPEIFVKINGSSISSYPMKGTIDASIADAENTILSDFKEQAEHATIVDLIRNDLSMVAKNVRVEKYRYIDKVITSEKTLLQVSSKISGDLPSDWQQRLGDILSTLLPAGSVSGAPKPKTLEIINDTEIDNRGFYTGIFGIFDGENLDSGVMIRYIENVNNQFFYRSGGGITAFSNVEKEYQELIDKIYVPIC